MFCPYRFVDGSVAFKRRVEDSRYAWSAEEEKLR